MANEIPDIDLNTEIISERIFTAPIEKVFRAWTDPVHLAKWWGPAGFSNTFLEHDLKPGGKWKFIMHGPDKGNYPNEVVFIKIEKPYLIAWQRISQPLFKVVASFEEIAANKTHVVFRMIFDTEEERNKLIRFVPEKNEENFDRLEAELLRMPGAI